MKNWKCICGCGRNVGGIYHSQKCRDKVLLSVKEENRVYQKNMKTKVKALEKSNIVKETLKLVSLGLLFDERWKLGNKK